ncbi:amino acid kinase family protein [Candidatus Vidania fulgoroideorum]
MKLVVHKYGGTSLGSTTRILGVSKRLRYWVDNGYKLIVIVSAFYGATNKLSSIYRGIFSNTNSSEGNAFISIGEHMSSCLLSSFLNTIGCSSIFLSSWQVPIITTNFRNVNIIKYIGRTKIINYLSSYDIVIVCGFQGVDKYGFLRLLSRGGSDTSAVYIANTFNLKKCYIYTDVDGIYSLDPNVIYSATKFAYIDYFSMIELSSVGSKVLQISSIYTAAVNLIKLVVLSSLYICKLDTEKSRGTIVSNRKLMIKSLFSSNEVFVKLQFLSTLDITSFFIFISNSLLCLDMIRIDYTNISVYFTTNYSDFLELSYSFSSNVSFSRKVCKVSIIGLGIKNCNREFYRLFKILNSLNIKIYNISSSELRISFITSRKYEVCLLKYLSKKLNI